MLCYIQVRANSSIKDFRIKQDKINDWIISVTLGHKISNVFNAKEGACLHAMKIVHHHANGRFDWLISEY